MDYLDSILVLIEYVDLKLKRSHDAPTLASLTELKKELVISITRLSTINLYQPFLNDSDRELCVQNSNEIVHQVQSLIQHVEETFQIKVPDLMKHELKSSHVSKQLYLDHAKGIISHSKVSQIPSFFVRGRNYLNDGKKVHSHGSLFCLRGIQMVELEEFQTNVALQDWCGFPKFPQDNEWIILNFMIPGASAVHVVALFSALPEIRDILRNQQLRFDTHHHRQQAAQFMHGLPHDKKAMIKLLKNFWNGNDDYCNDRCKLIPTIIEGNWAVKMAVGQKPVILGKKVTQRYFRGNGYFEIDIDLSTSVVATHILGLVRGYSKDMIVDLGITLEGETEEELPEVILCQARFDHVDLESATPILR